MKYNRDGTPYQLDTVLETIEHRFKKQRYPLLSDLLGSDWGVDTPQAANSEEYKAQAIERAGRLYKNS